MKGKQSAKKVNSNIDINDGVYDEYNNDYKRYLQTHQEFSLEKTKSNTKIEPPTQFPIEAQSDDKSCQKVMKTKWCVIGAAIGGMVVGALVVGSPVYFLLHPYTYSKCHDITNSTTMSLPSPNESSTCIWTAWVDASRCHFDQNVGNGFRLSTRCCATQNGSDNLDSCNDERDVMECSPRE